MKVFASLPRRKDITELLALEGEYRDLTEEQLFVY